MTCQAAIASLDTNDEGSKVAVITDCASILHDAHEGDSISINGTCLTVTSFTPNQFTVGISPETLRRTDLGRLKKADGVNLERAVSASTRMGGHFVQGHVDTVASIISITPDGDALTFRFQPRDDGVLRYIVEKGYVTLDGTSLTVTKVDDVNKWFEIMLITYSQERVVLSKKKPGDDVNVEVDMVGKYVEKSVQGYLKSLGEEGRADKGALETLVEKIVAKKVG